MPRACWAGPCRSRAAERPRQTPFWSIASEIARRLKQRYDHESNHMREDFQSETKCLGIETSATLFRAQAQGQWRRRTPHPTLKENLLWAKTFRPIGQRRSLNSPSVITRRGSSPGTLANAGSSKSSMDFCCRGIHRRVTLGPQSKRSRLRSQRPAVCP